MNKGKCNLFLLIISVMLVLTGCSQSARNSTDSLNISESDKKIIEKYLDTRTNDISTPHQGKMFSAYEILGTDEDRIYLWMLKEEYYRENGKIEMTNGTSIPVVLYVEAGEKGIKIMQHRCPEDGELYPKSMKKLFPRNVRGLISIDYNERVMRLRGILNARVEKEL